MTQELDPQLWDAIQVGLDALRVDTRTAIPATVVAYDSRPPETCTVELGFRAILRDGSDFTLPRVEAAPIVWPGGGGFASGVDLEVGDEVLCIIADRALDAWVSGGGSPRQTSLRTHDITDCVVIPGLRSAKTAIRFKRGRGVYYIGSTNGQAPYMKLRKGTPSNVEIEATTIRLGANAAAGVARIQDNVRPSLTADGAAPIGMVEWMTAVAGVVNGFFPGTVPPVPPSFIGVISTGSSKVTAE